MPAKILKTLPKPDFDRHSRKCVICHHPDRAAIEEEFVGWRPPWRIAEVYDLDDYRAVHRHAHATGLTLRRRQNVHAVLDLLLEQVHDAKVSGDSILRAIRAYSCVDARGRWVDPPTQVNFSSVASVASVSSVLVLNCPRAPRNHRALRERLLRSRNAPRSSRLPPASKLRAKYVKKPKYVKKLNFSKVKMPMPIPMPTKKKIRMLA